MSISMARGAFIVLEGLDRTGKSTQVTLLLQALKERSIPVEKRVFPDRSTRIGAVINDYLTKKMELAPEAAPLLFSVNRWECKDSIHKTLESGTTLVVDRYAASGAAYSAATTERSLEWSRTLDQGLPAPDLVLFLDLPEEAQSARANWGDERYERAEIQRRARENFHRLAEPATWSTVRADRSPEEVHATILEKALAVIEAAKNQPLATL